MEDGGELATAGWVGDKSPEKTVPSTLKTAPNDDDAADANGRCWWWSKEEELEVTDGSGVVRSRLDSRRNRVEILPVNNPLTGRGGCVTNVSGMAEENGATGDVVLVVGRTSLPPLPLMEM